MVGQDILTSLALGIEPSLESYLELLPVDVRVELVGATSDADTIARARALEDNEHAKARSIADLLIHAQHIEPEDLAPILQASKVREPASGSTFASVYALIKKVGVVKAHGLLVETIKLSQLSPIGTFTDHRAKDRDLSQLAMGPLEVALEKDLEERMGKGVRRKLVKVRATWIPHARLLVIAFYQQRPDKDGRDVEREQDTQAERQRKLVTKQFAQTAAAFYVTLKRDRRRVIVTFRSAASKTSQRIRESLSHVIWGTAGAVEAPPMKTFGIDAFLSPNFAPTIPQGHRKRVSSIAISEIRLSIASGNNITIHGVGDGENQIDALDDYKRISANAPAISQGATVERVTLRFVLFGVLKPTVFSATIHPDSIRCNEMYRPLVVDHLDAWAREYMPEPEETEDGSEEGNGEEGNGEEGDSEEESGD